MMLIQCCGINATHDLQQFYKFSHSPCGFLLFPPISTKPWENAKLLLGVNERVTV